MKNMFSFHPMLSVDAVSTYTFLFGNEVLTIRPPQVMLRTVVLSWLLSSTLWIRSQFKRQVCFKTSSELAFVRLDDRTDADRLVSKPCVCLRTTNWRYRFWKMYMWSCTRTWRDRLRDSPDTLTNCSVRLFGTDTLDLIDEVCIVWWLLHYITATRSTPLTSEQLESTTRLRGRPLVWRTWLAFYRCWRHRVTRRVVQVQLNTRFLHRLQESSLITCCSQ